MFPTTVSLFMYNIVKLKRSVVSLLSLTTLIDFLPVVSQFRRARPRPASHQAPDLPEWRRPDRKSVV